MVFLLDLLVLALALHGLINIFWSFLSVLIVHWGETTASICTVAISGCKTQTFKETFAQIRLQIWEELLPFIYGLLVIAAYTVNAADDLNECPDFQQTNDGSEISFVSSTSYNHCFTKEASVLLGCASVLGWGHFLQYLKGTQLGGLSGAARIRFTGVLCRCPSSDDGGND